jgi:peptidoglycan/xylan/chitin deacetylase (PgdA/CDA1 family)
MIANLASRVILHLDGASAALRASFRQVSRRPATVFLMLHSVGGLPDAPYVSRGGTPSMTTGHFRELLRFFARRGFKTLTASEFAQRQAANQLEPRTLVLTFDDGFRDNYTLAAPILADMGMTATFYPVCGWIGRNTPAWLHRAAWYADQDPTLFTQQVQRVAGQRWTSFLQLFRSRGDALRDALLFFRQALRPAEQRAALETLAQHLRPPPPASLYMDWRELGELQRAGMEIGAHTMTHRSLWTLPLPVAQREIRDPKGILENRLGVPVHSFAYPYGHFLPEHPAVIQAAGYTHAVTVRPHHNATDVPPFELGRYGLNSEPDWAYLGRIALARTENPLARLNRWLGRHLTDVTPDPELGMIRLTSSGWAYDTAPAALALQTPGGAA